jgi:tRNA pseudouridine32 synthase / 23S rRNA pseudouridine746 synthase
LTQTQSWTAQAAATDETAVDALARVSQLSKSRIKDAMGKGAVWLKRGKDTNRLRRSSAKLRSGDSLTLYYNPDILALTPPAPTLVADERVWSLWDKPPGLLAQGSREGDHCSVLRIVEQQLGRDVFLVHRLDREASGLMLVAHTRKAAAAFSALFARQQATPELRKVYRVEVKGELPAAGVLQQPLDGKAAETRYTREACDAAQQRSVARVELITGRKHQIRRHFAEAGFPVLGDPVYGSNNKDPRGLQLRAMELAFTCPLTGKLRAYRLPALVHPEVDKG